MFRRARFVAAGAVAAAVVMATSELTAAIPPLRLIPYAQGFVTPVAFIQDPADRQVQFVVEQIGRIRTLVSGDLQPAPFLDIRDKVNASGERGMLGLAFPPDAATSHRFYVYYSNLQGNSVVSRFTRASNPRIANASSEVPMTWSTGLKYIDQQPYSNHKGGCLAFGSDGYLYIGLGDGGSGNDPENRAQNPAELLGKMLRIDVSGNNANGFVVPPSNPFVGDARFRPEIWAIGLRNPWRFSFDLVGAGATGAMIIADVGQSRWEEVNYEPAGRGGRNYGWVTYEGTHPTINVDPNTPTAGIARTDPVYEYDHSVGRSITGGYIYRGTEMPGIRGRYFFADYVTSRIWSAAVTVNGTTREATFSDVIDHTNTLESNIGSGNVSALGIDTDGELFVIDYARGAVLRLTQARKPVIPTGLRIIR